jgi:hypothetical protein
MAHRTFTLAEANAALERVRPLAAAMVDHHRALAVAQRTQARIVTRIAGNGGGMEPSELAESRAIAERESRELARCLHELQEIGVQVKGMDDGLVDFPSLRGGEEVLLCWRLGEEEIRFWHGTDEGFASRKPL